MVDSGVNFVLMDITFLLVLWFLEAVFVQWFKGKFIYRTAALRGVRSAPSGKEQCPTENCGCFLRNEARLL